MADGGDGTLIIVLCCVLLHLSRQKCAISFSIIQAKTLTISPSIDPPLNPRCSSAFKRKNSLKLHTRPKLKGNNNAK